MATLTQSINVNDLPEDNGGDFAPIPAGMYNVRITDADIKDTRRGDGQFIKIRMDVTGPSHEGRVVFTNINIKNPSQKAEEIGRQQLGSIMRAIGVTSLQDTDQLIGGALQVKVAIRKSEEYGDQNEVKSFKAMEGGAQTGPGAAAAGAGGSQAAASGKPPWAR